MAVLSTTRSGACDGAAAGYDYAGEDVHRGLAAAGIVAGAAPGGKVALKIGAKVAAKKIADAIPPAKRNSHQTVLGRNPDYVHLSDELHARRFEIPPDVWTRMTPGERWEANKRFLDRMIRRGDEIILSNSGKAAPSRTIFLREINYLKSLGYRVSDDGMRMLPP